MANAKGGSTSVWSILLLSLAAVGPVFQAWNYLSHGFDVLSGPYGRLALLLLIVAGSGIAAIPLMRQTLAGTQRFAHRTGARVAGSLLLFLNMAFILALGIGWAVAVRGNGPLPSSRLPEDVFGIAIAPFGEGQVTEITDLSLQATSQLSQELAKELRRAGLGARVALQTIGPVVNREDALQWGDRVGAEMVLWGRMVPGQPEATIPRWTDSTHWETSHVTTPTEVISASMKGNTVLVSDGTPVPHKTHAMALAGQAAIYLGEYDLAITQFDLALDAIGEISGDTSTLRGVWLRYRGYAHWNAGQSALARDDFIASVQLHPDALTYIDLGNLRLGEGDLLGAVGNYRAALAADPYRTTPYIGLGYAYAGQGEITAAIDQFQQARRLQPGFAPAYYVLGLLYRDHGDVFLARQAFDHCIVLAEGNEELITAANEELGALPLIPVTPTPSPTPVSPIVVALTSQPTITLSASASAAETVSTQRSYVVQRNDNLTAIATRFGTTVEAIVKANNLRSADSIYVGQELIIPTE